VADVYVGLRFVCEDVSGSNPLAVGLLKLFTKGFEQAFVDVEFVSGFPDDNCSGLGCPVGHSAAPS